MEPVPQERGRSAQSTRTKAGHPRWSRTHGGPCPSGQDCGFTAVSHALASLFPNPFRCAAAVWRRQSCKDALPRSTGDLLCMFPASSGKGPTLNSLPDVPEHAASKEMPAALVACRCCAPRSRLSASPTPTPELWGTCPRHFGSNKSLFPADSTYILLNNSVFYRTWNMMADLC